MQIFSNFVIIVLLMAISTNLMYTVKYMDETLSTETEVSCEVPTPEKRSTEIEEVVYEF